MSSTPTSQAEAILARELAKSDAMQGDLMAERVIVIDENDNVTGSTSKGLSHLRAKIDGPENLLHRAFSVFLFNSRGELLLQQRSDDKITFPGYWTNTCCSHPLMSDKYPDERDGERGVRHAARRKLEHELGIDPASINLDSFHYITRLHYKAPSCDVWGEHEIDYVLFLQQDVPHSLVLNEVQATQYVTKEGLRELLATAGKKGLKITPWFKLICER